MKLLQNTVAKSSPVEESAIQNRHHSSYSQFEAESQRGETEERGLGLCSWEKCSGQEHALGYAPIKQELQEFAGEKKKAKMRFERQQVSEILLTRIHLKECLQQYDVTNDISPITVVVIATVCDTQTKQQKTEAGIQMLLDAFPRQLVEEAGAVSGSGSGQIPSLFLAVLGHAHPWSPTSHVGILSQSSKVLAAPALVYRLSFQGPVEGKNFGKKWKGEEFLNCRIQAKEDQEELGNLSLLEIGAVTKKLDAVSSPAEDLGSSGSFLFPAVVCARYVSEPRHSLCDSAVGGCRAELELYSNLMLIEGGIATQAIWADKQELLAVLMTAGVMQLTGLLVELMVTARAEFL
ncbi:hypothetical protein IHE44_0001237 [Lamprotornis superbus]|uniref:Uncharacterized protein n=1 Tax=Lamprotornis superbus TaxID=245042 RepID=A0A835NUN5_9PASS|nr:hypothetical protein IHE44_0001237 [Lamprotornis superbus]